MLKSEDHELTDFIVEFEPPDDWEQLRDEDGNIQEGCYRTKPAADSDEYEW